MQTKNVYQATSSVRHVNRDKVYNVNIPFCKDAKITNKPGSATGFDSEHKMQNSP